MIHADYDDEKTMSYSELQFSNKTTFVMIQVISRFHAQKGAFPFYRQGVKIEIPQITLRNLTLS